VIAAAVSGVVTSLVTAHPSSGLWVGLVVVVIVGAVLQGVVSYGENKRRQRVEASGAGAVAVGGSARQGIQTRVIQKQAAAAPPRTGEPSTVAASGPGSVAVGGDMDGPVATDVTD
jgi:hypothetical protein